MDALYSCACLKENPKRTCFSSACTCSSVFQEHKPGVAPKRISLLLARVSLYMLLKLSWNGSVLPQSLVGQKKGPSWLFGNIDRPSGTSTLLLVARARMS
jgi:hypothetical protein